MIIIRIGDMLAEENPLFTAKVNQNGQITIREDVRRRKDIKIGDLVDVFDLRKTNHQ